MNTLTVEIISADMSAILSALSQQGIIASALNMEDDITATMAVEAGQLEAVRRIVTRKDGAIRVIRRRGLRAVCANAAKRPILIMGLLLLLGLGMYLPSRVLFVTVAGNQNIPARLILEKAEQCGIRFGASRRDVRSEQMKNALLEALPQLQWAGVNTSGCVAVVSVREREMPEKGEQTGVSSIVAVTDAVIESVTVTAGTSCCVPGQAVQQGQVLISGYTDCGISVRAERAVGEVYGVTERCLAVILPQKHLSQDQAASVQRCYSLIIGKKRINFSKDSGISDATCDRMYEENYVTLPGGFQLPIALAVEVRISYSCREADASEDQALSLHAWSEAYVSRRMSAGQILIKDAKLENTDGGWLLTARYACREMIGREQKEEIMTPYGNDNGIDGQCGAG